MVMSICSIVEEVFEWVDSTNLIVSKKSAFEVVFMVTIWVLWTYQNAVTFRANNFHKDMIFDRIIVSSFTSFGYRFHKLKVDWVNQMKYPVLSITLQL